MYKVFYSLCISLGLLLAGPSTAADVEQLTKVCFFSSPIYAVPACEQLMESNDVDHKVHFHLAKLYQKQNQLEKAKSTLERALEIFDMEKDAGVRQKTALVKSDVDEEIWLQGQSRQVDKSAEHRVKCLKFSNILPQKALSSCDMVLAANPDDSEAAKHKIIAQQKLSRPKKTPEVLVASREAMTSAEKTAIDSSKKPAKVSGNKMAKVSSKKTLSKKKKAALLPEPVVALVEKVPPKKKQTKPKPVSSSISTATVPEAQADQVLIDPKVIADIKSELSGLYALLKEEQVKNAARPKVEKFDYQERGKRYALVVGNANYSPAIGKLKNAVNDAVDIGKKLKKLGFEVQTLTDSNLQKMEAGVAKIAQKIRQDDTVLFYYAGHGVAIEGENYLLPTGMGIKDAVDVKYKSLNLSYVLDKLDRGSNGVTMVVLDACRNNPFPVSRGVGRAGLVQASGPVGTIIAYSTAPGDVAQDGSGRNGLYTKHLLAEMSKPNIKLEDVFKKVRVAVEDDTQGSQVPWENSSLKGDFYFTYN